MVLARNKVGKATIGNTPVEGLIKAAALVNGKRFIYPIPWRISEDSA